MSRQRGIRIAKVLFVVAIAAVGFMAVETLTSGITPTTQAVCLHGTCPPGSPEVYCSDHHVYANICIANAACQYNCCVIGTDGCGDPT